MEDLFLATGTKLAIYDFGGTVFDFLPIHQSCFADAVEELCGRILDMQERTCLDSTVAGLLDTGLSSVEISTEIADRFSVACDPERLAFRKRKYVEERLVGHRLSPAAIRHLNVVRERIDVAVVTLGRADSTAEILEASMRPPSLPVFGRSSEREVVTKPTLIQAAIKSLRHGGTAQVTVVGDSLADENAAKQLGLSFAHCDGLWK